MGVENFLRLELYLNAFCAMQVHEDGKAFANHASRNTWMMIMTSQYGLNDQLFQCSKPFPEAVVINMQFREYAHLYSFPHPESALLAIQEMHDDLFRHSPVDYIKRARSFIPLCCSEKCQRKEGCPYSCRIQQCRAPFPQYPTMAADMGVYCHDHMAIRKSIMKPEHGHVCHAQRGV